MAPLPPFRVVFVEPISSNVLRAYVSQEPRHFSALGVDDALRRTNWSISIASGPGSSPVVEKVENPLARPGTVGLIDDTGINGAIPAAWSVDLRVDRRLLAPRTRYLTVAGSALRSVGGTAMTGSPYDRDLHPGRIERLRPAFERPASMGLGIDFRYDPFTGAFLLDSKLDVAVHSGLEALKKRILRRLMTTPGGFFHLPTYGAGLIVKGPMNSQELSRVQRRVRQQVQAEAEILAVDVNVARLAEGVLLVTIKARTVLGLELDFGLEVPAEGSVVVV